MLCYGFNVQSVVRSSLCRADGRCVPIVARLRSIHVALFHMKIAECSREGGLGNACGSLSHDFLGETRHSATPHSDCDRIDFKSIRVD